MIYQDMMVGRHPYYVSVGQAGACREHRHPEIELSYCAEGSYEVQIDKKTYTVPPNHLAVIGSMVSHRTCGPANPKVISLTVEISPVLLLEYFEPFSKAVFPSPVFSLDKYDKKFSELLSETIVLAQNRTGLTELMIKGNVYKICYYIYEEFIKQTDVHQNPRDFRDVKKIEAAMELIHSSYAQPLTVEYVASLTQYSESHFCKVFKKVTGITFHDALNRCRIRNACCLLKETTSPIAEVAIQVGFTDVKTFNRVFKQYTGCTPKNYRNDDTISLGSLRI